MHREHIRKGWFEGPVDALVHDARLDRVARPVGAVTDLLGNGRFLDMLRGVDVGHALHPMFTDFPLGCWTSAALLDVVGGRAGRVAARRLIAAGLLGVPATALTGLADWSSENRQSTTRLGGLHAALNTTATVLYAGSWWARRRRRHGTGVLLSGAGLALVSASAYLGGHMAFALGTGTGHREPPHTEVDLDDLVADEVTDPAPDPDR